MKTFMVIAGCLLAAGSAMALSADDTNIKLMPEVDVGPAEPGVPVNPGGWTGTVVTPEQGFERVDTGSSTVGENTWIIGGSESSTSSTKPTCASLGYDVSLSSANMCNGNYFPCPFDAKVGKCDETATVGDIKYSKLSSGAGTGWLKCDGSTFSAAKYPKLSALLGTSFGGTSATPKLPDYRGVYLRGAGTLKLTSSHGRSGTTVGKAFSRTNMTEMQDPTVVKHYHYYKEYRYWGYYRERGGKTSKKYNAAYPASGEVNFPFKSGSSSVDTSFSEVCPLSIGLFAYIYAGAPAY